MRKTVEISNIEGSLFLNYSPDVDIQFISDKLKIRDEYLIKYVFLITQDDIIDIDEDRNEISIQIGEADGEYFRIFSQRLNTAHDVLIHRSAKITPAYFGLNINTNILKIFENIANTQIIIGGNKENSIPISVYETLLQSFPNAYEKQLYTRSRISNILSEYIESTKDYGKQFENYLNKKSKKVIISNTIASVKTYETEKYDFILQQLKLMLDNYKGFSEADWQSKILEFITIIYPKYLLIISNLHIFDYTSSQIKNRYVDLTLLDVNGNIDVIEIKKPMEKGVLSPHQYRDNFIPSRELSGAVMQLEKYLFHLNKMGSTGESFLNKKYKNILEPYNLQIKITNPKGIIISGISSDFNAEQKLDFEIIKRKYSNIIDIITYDDLINRLENLITKFQ